MQRTLVISDIHGELEMFEQLLEKVNYHSETDQLILLGDYVDRGPDSRGVLNKVMELKEKGAIVLRGNHDEMMVEAYDNKEKAWERWIRNGYLPTFQSYDSNTAGKQFPDTEEMKKHIAFIKSLDYYHITDKYIFVHAGVDPDTPIEETDPQILVWIRDKFHDGYKGDKTVIFGHTVTANLRKERGNFNIYYGKNNIIGIDGGAVYGGRLNCLDLTNNDVFYIEAT